MEQNKSTYPIRVAQIMGKMNNGGVEAVVMNYYRHVDRNKIQFDFIIDSDSSCPQKEEIESLGGRVFFVHPYTNIRQYCKDLKKIFIENKYKIVHSQITSLSVFPLRVAKKCGIPVRIVHAHSTSCKGEILRNMIKQFLKFFSKKYANNYFACGEYAGKWLFGTKAFNKGKVVIVPNGINVEKFSFNPDKRLKIRKELGLTDDNLVIGHIGRFVTQKNHKFLIDLFERINKINPSSKLLLIGEGPLTNEIKQMTIKKKIDDSVIFLGVKNDTSEFYNAFDIFMLPSLYEGLPVVGIEAQCNGLPVLFSNHISKEVLLNENVKMIPLNIVEWSDLKELYRTSILNISNYNIKDNALFLEQKYINLWRKYDH